MSNGFYLYLNCLENIKKKSKNTSYNNIHILYDDYIKVLLKIIHKW